MTSFHALLSFLITLGSILILFADDGQWTTEVTGLIVLDCILLLWVVILFPFGLEMLCNNKRDTLTHKKIFHTCSPTRPLLKNQMPPTLFDMCYMSH